MCGVINAPGQRPSWKNTWYTVHCTFYTIHCTLYTAHCKLYTVSCTLYTAHHPETVRSCSRPDEQTWILGLGPSLVAVMFTHVRSTHGSSTHVRSAHVNISVLSWTTPTGQIGSALHAQIQCFVWTNPQQQYWQYWQYHQAQYVPAASSTHSVHLHLLICVMLAVDYESLGLIFFISVLDLKNVQSQTYQAESKKIITFCQGFFFWTQTTSFHSV